MSALEAAIIAAFVAYVIGARLHERGRASAGLEQYFLAGRELNGWQAGLSMAATQFAADTPLLLTGLVAASGIFALWRPPGLTGLLLTGMIAALASTVDTHLNWGASYLTHDLYRRLATRARGVPPGERSLVSAARLSNLLLLAVAFAVMAHLGSIRAAWEAGLLLGAGVGIVLVLRWLWWRVTAWSELAAIAVSALAVPLVLGSIADELAPLRLLVVATGSTAAAVAASPWIRPAAPADLVEFFRRVRPPGARGPVARLAGHDPRLPLRALGQGVAAMLACATTLFCALVGLGTWLVEATPPPWLPQRGAWIALNLAVAALPFRLRSGFLRAGRSTMRG